MYQPTTPVPPPNFPPPNFPPTNFPPPAYAAPKLPWFRRTWGIAVIAAVCLLIGIATGQGASAKKTSSNAAASASTVTATATKTVSAHRKSRPHTAVAAPKAVTKPARKPAARKAARTHSAANGANSLMWAMPNEVGQVLQNAQDDLQRLSGDPVFFSHSHDLLGTRFQILDSDWQVCTQNVAPGTQLGQTAHVDFGVVKTYEQCP